MYPSLYYMFKDLFGIEGDWWMWLDIIKTFGAFVAISFLLAAYFFAKELKRKEAEGKIASTTKERKFLKGEAPKASEIGVSALIGFVLFYKFGYILMNGSEFVKDAPGVLLSLKGNLIGGLVGGALFGWSRYREMKKNQLDKPVWATENPHPFEHVPNMTLIAAIAGILGAKIFHNLENMKEFMEKPLESLMSFSGLTMYGGLICASVAVIYYAYKNNINIPHLIDACAPSLMLAYGTGRIGCQLAGDGDWGIVNNAPKPSWFPFPDWAWAYNYPNNVNSVCNPYATDSDAYLNCHCRWEDTPHLIENVFPTPLYEAVVCILLFFVLWSVRKRFTTPGVLFCIYLILNGIERFLIEKIRVNTTYDWIGMTQAEIISLLLIVLGIAGIFYFRKQQKNASAQS